MHNLIHKVRRRLRLMPKSRALEIYAAEAQKFSSYTTLLAFHEDHFAQSRDAEAAMSRRGGQHPIYFSASDHPVAVDVATSAMFLDMYNFRESFIDPAGLNARQRHLLFAVQSRLESPGKTVALFEYNTPFHNELRRSGLKVTPSHYVENLEDPFREDMQSLSYSDGLFDFAVHCDVLEHVPNQRKALAECYRILKPGGRLLFTTPVFPMKKNVLRAEIGSDGTLIRHYPDEIHGDNLTGGVLAFHNFGWELIENMREAGFINCCQEVCVSSALGLFSSNCPLWTSLDPLIPGNMLPLVLVAEKPV